MKITISGFSGAIQALHAKLLPAQIGIDSRNQKPGRGDLRPWNQPLTVATVASGTKSIYRYQRDTSHEDQYWQAFDSATVRGVRTYKGSTIDASYPQNGSFENETIFTGVSSGNPTRLFLNGFILGVPDLAYLNLGLPAPTIVPNVSVLTPGTSTQMETLYYVFTYTDGIRESAPGPVSSPITCRVDDVLAIGGYSGGPPPSGYGITDLRIYRTNTGDVGDTDFFFVETAALVPPGPASVTDNFSQLGEPLETTDWALPPSDLDYITAMWNGMLAGISDGSVRFCEPFVEYAWPLKYAITPPDARPLALGRWEQNLLVLTTAKPLLVTGTAPDSLDQQPLEIGEACIAPRAVVSFGHGVAWPSTDGLIYFGNGGGKNLTAGIFTRDDWQALNPSTMVAGQYMGAYVCFYTDGSSVRRGFIIDPLSPTAVYFLDTGYDALWFDELQDKLFVLNGTSVQKWDAGASPMTATFRSKIFETPPSTMGALRVDADGFPVTVKVDAGPFTSGQATAIAAASGGLLTSTGTAVRYTVTVNDRDPVRMPGGFRATDWVVQIESTSPVQTVMLANNIEELA